MNAIILSAGQGRRLMPHTQDLPKCLLPVDGDRPVLEVQLRALRDGGITDAQIMVGFQADKVEAFLATRPVRGIDVRCVYNPFFDSTDNLVTAWLARSEMKGDFLLLNGDTLFEPSVLRCLLAAPEAPITLVVNGKDEYDADDMKVSVGPDGRIRAISKTLVNGTVNGESIGLMRFRGKGVDEFRVGLDRAVRTQRGLHAYYLSVIDDLSRKIPVETALMTGLWWGELDSPEDLFKIRAELAEVGPRREDRIPAHQVAHVVSHPSTRADRPLRDRQGAKKPKRRPAAQARSTNG